MRNGEFTYVIGKAKRAFLSNDGFSIVEMVVAIAIISIIAGIAVPYTMGWRTAQKVNAAAIAVATELNEAKMLAISRNANTIVAFDPSTKTIKTYLDVNADGIDISDLIRSMSLSEVAGDIIFGYNQGAGIEGATISQAVKMGNTSNPIRVTFVPNGQAINIGAIYLISTGDLGGRNDRQRAVAISKTGRISRWKYVTGNTPGPWMEMI